MVRRINQKLPPAARLRILGAEPSDREHRDTHIARVMEREVISKQRKAVMFYGGGHLRKGIPENAVTLIEAKSPGIVFVVGLYAGGVDRNRCGLPASVSGIAHEAKMASWPVPSLVRTKGTWLADFAWAEGWPPRILDAAAKLRMKVSPLDPIDAYLYLGPPSLLLAAPVGGRNFADPQVEQSKFREQSNRAVVCEDGVLK